MSVIQVGLVDVTGKLDPELVESTAAALNIQAMRDLPQFWNVQATVRYLPSHKRIPVGVWPIRLVASLPPGEGGIHLDKHHQPYSLVAATPQSDDWTMDASHEMLEMLVDPFGNRLQTSRGIQIVGGKVKDGPGEFQYLVEACDPCEDTPYGYSIQGVAVSDFITPRFYDPVTTPGTRYSFTGSIKAPRQLLPGGYISFINTEIDQWQQILYLGSTPQLKTLGQASGNSLRVWIDSLTNPLTIKRKKPSTALAQECEARRASMADAAMIRASFFEPEPATTTAPVGRSKTAVAGRR